MDRIFFFCKSILFLYLFFVENVIFPQKMIFRKISQMDKNSRFRLRCVVASFLCSPVVWALFMALKTCYHDALIFLGGG
jgi:hypothetical protein